MELIDEYLTITDSPAEGFYSEKRSKFLAFAFHVTTEEEVKNIVAEHRKKYYDARHVCWAYTLGADHSQFRANDDGEPSSTAGKPILGQIVKNDVYLMDVYPTLCELCGVEVPASVDGVSFAGMFTDPEVKTHDSMYFAFQSRIRGVKKGHFKLVEYRTEDLKLSQLFDLEADPWEMCNFYDIAGYENITEELRHELFALRDSWDDE